jgi:hypothetical protein
MDSIIMPFCKLSMEFFSKLSNKVSCCWPDILLNLSHSMQHSNIAKELLSDHWEERVVVVQQMAGLHHDFIWGQVWRRRGRKGHEIHV